MEDNGGLSYVLDCPWEKAMAELVILARVSNGFSNDADSLVIREACKEYEWDFLTTFRVVKEAITKIFNNTEE